VFFLSLSSVICLSLSQNRIAKYLCAKAKKSKLFRAGIRTKSTREKRFKKKSRRRTSQTK
jgi:hypothetical protein